MSQFNTIEIPIEEGSQLPISDSLTSPDSGVTASSKAVYNLNNRITTLEAEVDDITPTLNVLSATHTTDINAIKALISNVDNIADTNKTVGAARKLATARTIGGVSFDGTTNIDLPGVNISGNQNTTGNAATATLADKATKLASQVTIGGVAFDGTSSINLPGVNTTGNQNTSGHASSSTHATYADYWTNDRTLTLSGAVNGSVVLRGNSDMSMWTSGGDAVTSVNTSVSGSGYYVTNASLSKSGSAITLSITKASAYADSGSE